MQMKSTKQLTTLAMLSAIACVLMLVVRINFMPAAPFLIYDPKDIIIALGGFILGPIAVVAMSFIVSFVEMITVSADGWVGFAMNVLSSCSFALPAAIIYRQMRTLKGAVLGLIIGWLFVTGVMIMWNYIITPIYRGFPRAAIVPMLSTIFLPFNLIKYGLGSATTMLLYKPLSHALQKAKLIEKPDSQVVKKGSFVTGIILAVCLAVVPVLVLIFVLHGVIF
ncbi:MAG: ECF transporter S component [Oscillospiraceae bacterium]|jgi:riboflavin transporter FmnP|nr:ECF transporter S component [Oscillospiraceae bacterium]